MNGEWKIWRPAIWLVMLGIAVMLLLSPWYFGAVFFGAAIGSAIRIQQRRRRAVAAASKRQPQRHRRSGGKR
jgi:hypothetical protein